jgi:hypothetical protein
MRIATDTHIPRSIAIAVMITGLLAGMVVGYRLFGGTKNTNRPPSSTQWIFPSTSPLVSPPAGLPAVKPPTGPPPR